MAAIQKKRNHNKLALSELHSSAYFEGPDGNKVFSHNLNLVEKRHYHIIGRLVALSIVQDGPGLHFMNTVLFKLMVGLDVEDLTVYAWELFLEATEDRSSPATFSMLMAFLTGANTIPPCGFHKKITVHFYTQEVGVTRLPYVSNVAWNSGCQGAKHQRVSVNSC